MEKGPRSLIMGAAITGLVLTGRTSGAAERAILTLVVHVSNQAGTSRAELTHAQAQTDRIFMDIGIRLAWSDVAVDGYDPRCGGFSLFVTLLSPEMSAQLVSQGGRENVLGSAASAAGRAFVHPGRVSELGARTRTSADALLGRVIAHEIGHLILPAGHSQIGIMTAGMETDPTRTSARFTVAEGRAIRKLLQSKGGNPAEGGSCG